MMMVITDVDGDDGYDSDDDDMMVIVVINADNSSCRPTVDALLADPAVKQVITTQQHPTYDVPIWCMIFLTM